MLWPSYGPHKKLSRGEEMNNFAREVELVKEKKLVCSLDLIINVFQARCQTPGCSNACTVKHHFIGTTLIVSCSCVSGHHFKFFLRMMLMGYMQTTYRQLLQFCCQETILPKLNAWLIFMGWHFCQAQVTTGCKGCTLFQLSMNGGSG